MINATPLTPDQFGALFTAFRTEAFRLEMLPVYDVPEEAESYAAFKAGQPPPPHFNDEWSSFIASKVGQGAAMRRVRLVPNPMTDYFRFEAGWYYGVNAAAGEDIRFISVDALAPILLTLPAVQDFWVFDRTQLVLMDYDEAGRFKGGRLATGPEIAPYLAAIAPLQAAASAPDLSRYS